MRKAILACAWVAIASFGLPATPEDFAIRLEQLPDTTDVLVVGSWTVDNVQG